MKTVVKGDFIELTYTGYANGEIFDSNQPEDLKKLDPKAEPQKTRLIIGQGMVVKGLDHELEDKEIGHQYTVTIAAKDAFGPRHASLIRPLPLKLFTEKKVHPRPGMSFVLDSSLVTIRAVSGARVIVDFNSPLAGKDLSYVFTIKEKIEDVAQKATIFFERFLRGVPEFDVGEKVIVKGPEQLKAIVTLLGEQFKLLVGKELDFLLAELKTEKPSSASEATQQSL